MKKNMVCTICPNSCEIEVEIEDKEIKSIKGHKCKRGIDFVNMEIIDPVRILTTTVRIKGAKIEMIPVKSNKPIKKGLLFEALKIIASIEVKSPVNTGDIIYKDILNTGADIVATRSL